MQRTWWLWILAMVLAAPVAADAGENVKEPATGISFSVEDGGYALLGVGVRKKLVFNIYAAALYVKVPDALEPLREGKTPYAPIIYGAFPRKMIMHFVRNVPGAKAKETFRSNLDRVMTAAERGQCVEDRKRYLDSMGGDIKKGQRFVLDYRNNRIRAWLGKKMIYETSNRVLIRGIFRIWYGPEPLSDDLKQGLVSRLNSVIR